MAQAAGDEVDEVEQTEEQKPLEKTHANMASSNLAKVNEFVEEKEMNQARIAAAMQRVEDAQKKKQLEDEERARKLAAVVIDKADVALIASEFELTTEAAELALRANNGDAAATLLALLR